MLSRLFKIDEPKIFTPEGTKTEKVYELIDGEIQEVGEFNIFESIQSYAEETSIVNIIKTYANQAGLDMLRFVPEFSDDVLDVSEVPNDFNNLQDYLVKLNNTIKDLSKEINKGKTETPGEAKPGSPGDVKTEIKEVVKNE